MVRLTAARLWTWARRRAHAAEAADLGTQYPTMREAARRFRCGLDDIELYAGDDPGGDDRYLGIAVAEGIPGVGSADIEPSGAWLVEAY